MKRALSLRPKSVSNQQIRDVGAGDAHQLGDRPYRDRESDVWRPGGSGQNSIRQTLATDGWAELCVQHRELANVGVDDRGGLLGVRAGSTKIMQLLLGRPAFVHVDSSWLDEVRPECEVDSPGGGASRPDHLGAAVEIVRSVGRVHGEVSGNDDHVNTDIVRTRKSPPDRGLLRIGTSGCGDRRRLRAGTALHAHPPGGCSERCVSGERFAYRGK